ICLKPRNGGLKMPFGPEIFRQAVSKMTSVAREVLQSAGLSSFDIKYLVPHQANQRITDRVARELGFERERIASVISEYGNTGSASVVLALEGIAGDLREGDYALLVTFGGGYSSAAMVLRAETAAAADSVAFGASAMQPDRIRAPNFVRDGPETSPCSQVTEMPPTTDSSIHCPNSTIPAVPTAVRTSIYSRRHTIKREADFIERLVCKGGPEIADYHLLDAWFDRIHYFATVAEISSEELLILRRSFGVAVSLATLQGLVCNQPHGYAGDFEIIDRIYTRHISADPRLMRWDAYFHSQAGARAVRNRKAYFHRLLDRHYLRRKPLQVLKIASGPGRCMFEWLSARPEADVNFDCVELDSDAIAYASALNQEFLSRILFRRQNAVRFRPTSQYDLIWAAGLFDYFNDRVFKAVLCRLLAGIAEGGELVIGNFSPSRRARAYMEFGGWKLNNRTAEALRTLAQECGVVGEAIHVGAEPEGVNLFLHIRRDDRAKS
ncbi:MAG: hypothetical protein H0U23_06720, partial [Blastocatellia bacterium]|nr:hypothetical protein [Blastocatellia bacterium]